MKDNRANDIYQVISDIISRPETQLYRKDSKLYVKIPSQDAPISGEFTVDELFKSVKDIIEWRHMPSFYALASLLRIPYHFKAWPSSAP